MHAIYYTVFILLHCLLVSSDRPNTNPNTMHDFRIEYSSGRFLLDEKPFILRAGEMPYFRIPRNSWRNSLIAMRGAGLNCVYTPIEWATHEPSPGIFKFEGDQDFQAFLNMAKEERLWAIVKPGPFIGEDRDFGGLPAWLLWQRPGILLNTKHPVYRMFVLRYLREVLARLRPLLAINGGPVIMVELEHSGDKEQTLLFVEELDPLVVLFAGEDISPHHGESLSTLEALLHPDVGETVRDRRRVHVSSLKFPGAISKLAMSVQLNLATVWGNVPTGMTHEEAAYLFYNLAARNESFCVHMFQGGTNFGFTAGAIIMPRSGRFTPLMTAYSSLSALSEDSLPGCNYYIIRDYLVGKHPEGLDRYWKNEYKMDSAGDAPWKHYERQGGGYPWPAAVSYGRLRLRSATCLLKQQTIRRLSSSAWHAYAPLTFEYLRQAAGFVLYETIVPKDFNAAVLRTPQLHDRAQVFVGPALMGILSRSAQRLQLPLFALQRGDVLRILVESEGRVALHLLPEQRYKGLTYDKDVTLDNIPLRNWTMYGFPMDNGSLIHEIAKSSTGEQECSVKCCPVLYSAEFTIQENISVPLDTHFDMAGWGRGFVFVNGHNLGRYWSTVGPQVSLYVPGSYLRAPPAINRLTVLELERAHPLQEVMSVSQPVFARFVNRVAPVLTAFLVLTVTLSVVAICARKVTAWMYET